MPLPPKLTPKQTATQLTHSLVTLTLGASDIGVHQPAPSCLAMIIDKAEILLHSFTPNNEQSMMSVSSNASSADASKDS